MRLILGAVVWPIALIVLEIPLGILAIVKFIVLGFLKKKGWGGGPGQS